MSEYEVEAVNGDTTLTLGGSLGGVRPGDKIKIHGLGKDAAPANGARLVTVIETRTLERGSSTPSDPTRLVTEYWSIDGRKLAEADKFASSSLAYLEGQVNALRGQKGFADEQLATARKLAADALKENEVLHADFMKLKARVDELQGGTQPKKRRRKSVKGAV